MTAARLERVPGPDTVLALGEVRTRLLATSGTLTGEESQRLLRLRSGDRVRLSTRPGPYAVSADVLTGVDCPLPAESGARVRVAGTVTARALLVGGRILQASARVAAVADGVRERGPWGRHLAEPGIVRPFGRLSPEDVAGGWLADAGRPGELDLGAVAERLLAELARQPLLDHRPPFTSRPTRLRWAVLRAPAGADPAVERFTLAGDGLRTARLRLPPETHWAAAAGFCEDLAVHDWLLTTLVTMIDRSRLGSADAHRALLAVRPAVDHLLHLWMPAAHLDPVVAPLWGPLEREPGFSRQWGVLGQRIRDQMALLGVLSRGAGAR
ncbi:SCO2521 family protein [Streptomyces sp. NPDC086549]|uniref:SCO2521 family protein n=1 Tax=Streptomyces sp. NPDC086549 TaxID=3365752 RepID=UPI0038096C7F